MADTTSTTTSTPSPAMEWIKKNMLIVGAGALALILMFTMGGKKKSSPSTVRLSKRTIRAVAGQAARRVNIKRRMR